MEHDFWHERWQRNAIGFHEGEVNTMLSAHIGALGLGDGARLFLPLCGKTRDIAWLLDRGYRVAGAELSEIAVQQLFEELGATPEVTPAGPLTLYAAPGIDIYAGDIFELSANDLGQVDAVYDRAALVALPDGMRARYAAHLAALTHSAPQLVITMPYDQARMDGPPFSVTGKMVRDVHGQAYTIEELARRVLPGGLKGSIPTDEVAWLLRPRGAASA